jgi:hypothetical protein
MSLENEKRKRELIEVLKALAGAATLAAPSLPGVGATIARVIAVGLGTVSLLMQEGATLEEALATVKRVRHIDTSVEDQRTDAAIAAKPVSVDPVTPPVVK